MEHRHSGRFIHWGQRDTAHGTVESFASKTLQWVQEKHFLLEGKIHSELNANPLEEVKGVTEVV